MSIVIIKPHGVGCKVSIGVYSIHVDMYIIHTLDNMITVYWSEIRKHLSHVHCTLITEIFNKVLILIGENKIILVNFR